MPVVSLTRAALWSLVVAGMACARTSGSSDTGAAAVSDTIRSPVSDSMTGNQTESYDSGAAVRDTTRAAASDSATGNQTESGVTDSTGQSTLGAGVGQTRPDQGQPVTSKGDTVNTGVDSSSTPQ